MSLQDSVLSITAKVPSLRFSIRPNRSPTWQFLRQSNAQHAAQRQGYRLRRWSRAITDSDDTYDQRQLPPHPGHYSGDRRTLTATSTYLVTKSALGSIISLAQLKSPTIDPRNDTARSEIQRTQAPVAQTALTALQQQLLEALQALVDQALVVQAHRVSVADTTKQAQGEWSTRGNRVSMAMADKRRIAPAEAAYNCAYLDTAHANHPSSSTCSQASHP